MCVFAQWQRPWSSSRLWTPSLGRSLDWNVPSNASSTTVNPPRPHLHLYSPQILKHFKCPPHFQLFPNTSLWRLNVKPPVFSVSLRFTRRRLLSSGLGYFPDLLLSLQRDVYGVGGCERLVQRARISPGHNHHRRGVGETACLSVGAGFESLFKKTTFK